MTRKKTSKTPRKSNTPETDKQPTLQDFFVLGHFVKYNVYLLAKAVVFSSIASKFDNVNDAIAATNSVITGLDQQATPRQETTLAETEQTH